MSENFLNFLDINYIVVFMLCNPGKTASGERIFSVMNMIWEKKSRLSVVSMKVILILRHNFYRRCRFYENIKKNKTDKKNE